MNRRLLAVTILAAGVVTFAATEAPNSPQAAGAPPVPAAAGKVPPDMTRAVQLVLKSFGYTIAVDGVYGPQTARVVSKWQAANGLVADGVAGPITQASLGLTPAKRGAQVAIPGPARSVEQIIRDVWPDELEAQALKIAWRESNYRPDVTSSTGCCHGVFQLHEVHLGWMGAFGVTSVAQLFDPEVNVRMAYELYKRNGWAPWAL